jgi:hypothetical protein
MTKENALHETSWDYLGHKQLGHPDYQQDWNQTLLTKINFLSAKIQNSSRICSADTIEINPTLLPIFDSLVYFDITNSVLTRYKVIASSDIENNVIYVYNKKWIDDLRVVFLETKKTTESTIGEITAYKIPEAIVAGQITEHQVDEYKKSLGGYITISNYFTTPSIQSTDEIYKQIKNNSKLPIGIIFYSYKKIDGSIDPWGQLKVRFSGDENEDNMNVYKMEEVKQQLGESFMFFNLSNEGEKYWKDYSDSKKTPNYLDKIFEAHQKYIDWWSPIDLACDSCLAPMSCHRFCESLLTYGDDWWERWLGASIPKDKKIAFKRIILKFIIEHYTQNINLNERR